MFGYITVNKMELKVKDYYKYRAFYCGLCRKLDEKYGLKGRVTLTYDMTFLVILLTSLYEKKAESSKKVCMMHPLTCQPSLANEFTDYAADMNLLLAYYNMKDNWIDDRDMKSMACMKVLKKDVDNIKKKYPRQYRVLANECREIHKCENRNEQDMDLVAYHFGKITEEIFIYKKDIWEDTLRKMGFYLGKFIYLMDAYDDLEEDMKKGSYNVFTGLSKRPGFDEVCRQILVMMMADASVQFEKLPVLKNVEILRNILYSGVWLKWDMKHRKMRNKDGSI